MITETQQTTYRLADILIGFDKEHHKNWLKKFPKEVTEFQARPLEQVYAYYDMLTQCLEGGYGIASSPRVDNNGSYEWLCEFLDDGISNQRQALVSHLYFRPIGSADECKYLNSILFDYETKCSDDPIEFLTLANNLHQLKTQIEMDQRRKGIRQQAA